MSFYLGHLCLLLKGEMMQSNLKTKVEARMFFNGSIPFILPVRE